MTIPFNDEKVRNKIDQFLNEKKFDKAAELTVAYAFARIPTEEIVKVLMDAIIEFKKQHTTPLSTKLSVNGDDKK